MPAGAHFCALGVFALLQAAVSVPPKQSSKHVSLDVPSPAQPAKPEKLRKEAVEIGGHGVIKPHSFEETKAEEIEPMLVEAGAELVNNAEIEMLSKAEIREIEKQVQREVPDPYKDPPKELGGAELSEDEVEKVQDPEPAIAGRAQDPPLLKEFYKKVKHSFPIELMGEDGNVLCLTEVRKGEAVQAKPCRGYSGQLWYWEENYKLKNSHDTRNCLVQKTYTYPDKRDPQKEYLHRLVEMGDCENIMPPTPGQLKKSSDWEVDPGGRLVNLSVDECLALDKKWSTVAITLPCAPL